MFSVKGLFFLALGRVICKNMVCIDESNKLLTCDAYMGRKVSAEKNTLISACSLLSVTTSCSSYIHNYLERIISNSIASLKQKRARSLTDDDNR